MKKYLEILKKCPLFDGIEEDSLLRMLTCLEAKVEFFDKKYTIFAEGSVAKYIGIVLSGSVQTVLVDYYGNRSIIDESRESDLFAEEFACAEIDSMAVSVISSEESYVMLIDCSHIIHTCQNNCSFHQRLIFNLMRGLAQKNISFHKKIEITSKRSTREKLLTYLSIMAKKSGHTTFDIPFDRQELADYLEVERSGLSAELSKMRQEGIIENRKNTFTLL